MNIDTTSIRDKAINLNHSDLCKMLYQVIYPSYLDGYDALSVMIVCVRGEKHQHDAYVHQGIPYISIALDHDSVAGLAYEALTVICKNELLSYLNSLPGLPERSILP